MVPGWGTMQEASLVTYLRNRHVGEEANNLIKDPWPITPTCSETKVMEQSLLTLYA